MKELTFVMRLKMDGEGSLIKAVEGGEQDSGVCKSALWQALASFFFLLHHLTFARLAIFAPSDPFEAVS